MNRKIHRIHFVGIGGAGMCGIAELLHNQGYQITGSDLGEGKNVARLRSLGVEVDVGHDRSHVGNAQVVVASSAIHADNAELVEARARKIPVIARAEMLAEIMRLKEGVAVGGSHGKTTTTWLIAHVLDAAGLDPTAVIGGRILGSGGEQGSARLGQGNLLIAEADESDGSFLMLSPVITVITNIDPEHLDHYGSFEAVQEAFVHFANSVPFWGLNVVCLDHPGVQSILPRLRRRYVTYGFSPQADLSASDFAVEGAGSRFRLQSGDKVLGEVRLPLPGRHNVANALACIAVALEQGVSFERIVAALADFGGIERRFEAKGEAAGVRVVDDYAHHPAELRATLAAARGVHGGRIVAVFQPHRYTRTRDCFDDFATAFHDSDALLVCDIFAAGDDPIPGVNGRALADAIAAHGHRNVRFVASLDEIADVLPKELTEGDLVLTLGAGDVSRLGPLLLERLSGGTLR
ncbi:MAG: UDP-N-acetylmuramate--L-alanine ligase [Deltaproteobacteria bacterium]|nr:UDP-N-acetylmuramate--L-alanine ligase [Deltaproteobacteria bacterium]MBW2696061.1 UDP-N-acetylmuramate--L-alanine ligase [Deltaproteobacteria bacterium]